MCLKQTYEAVKKIFQMTEVFRVFISILVFIKKFVEHCQYLLLDGNDKFAVG